LFFFVICLCGCTRKANEWYNPDGILTDANTPHLWTPPDWWPREWPVPESNYQQWEIKKKTWEAMQNGKNNDKI
jgi:hypothetical protein